MNAVLSDNENYKIVELLLNKGANVNLHDKRAAWTALHFAAQACRLDLVELLVKFEADIEAQDIYGNTPLWRAVFSSTGNGDVIELLLRAGANRHKKNNSGVSPYDLAHTIAN